MEQFTLENIRNVALLSHSGAGKTSLSEASYSTPKLSTGWVESMRELLPRITTRMKYSVKSVST